MIYTKIFFGSTARNSHIAFSGDMYSVSLTLLCIYRKIAKHTLKTLWCEYRKISNVCLVIFQHHT